VSIILSYLLNTSAHSKINDHLLPMNNSSEIETAFGRPARWSAALPAVLVGCGAFLLAVYGTWLLPTRLQPHYANALKTAQNQYQSQVTSSGLTVHWSLGEAAGELDVIFSRLVGLESGSAGRYWEWAEFLQNHADTVRRKVQDPAASMLPELRQRFLEQAQLFESKSREIFAQLAVGQSELQARALLRVAQWKYQQGIADFGVSEVTKLTSQLRKLLDGSAVESADRAAAEWLLVHLIVEQAWLSPTGERLVVDPVVLAEAWDRCQDHLQAHPETNAQPAWSGTAKLLAALLGKPWSDEQGRGVVAAVDSANDWQTELNALQGAAVDADWQAIAVSLSRQAERQPGAVTSGLARTICRLACSPHAEPPSTWAEQAELGLLLVAQVAPHLPEFSELLWECARQQSGAEKSPVQLSPQIPAMIARGQSAMLKHSVSALSAALAGQGSVARTHLELIRRAQANLGLVARVCLWRVQSMASQAPAEQVPQRRPVASEPTPEGALDAKQDVAIDAEVETEIEAARAEELKSLIGLMTVASELEPESGLNWFTLGTLQFRAGEYTEMRVSLAEAKKLLGDVPAIAQVLDAARGL
jgi:hypothetical protein